MRAVWPWREKSVPKAAGSGRVMLRAFVQAAIMAVVAGFFLRHGHTVTGVILLGLVSFVVISSLFRPSVFLAFEHFGKLFGVAVATGVTWLLLVPFYYLCFLPGRVALTLSGKDPLNRRFPSKSESLWIPRPRVENPAQYRKQF